MSAVVLTDAQLEQLADLIAARLTFNPENEPRTAEPAGLIDAAEVARRMGVPKAHVWAATRRGDLPTVRIGPRAYRYKPSDVADWVERRVSRRPRGTRS